MKRRGNHRLQKRRTNRLHNSRLEHLEARALLTADLWQSLETIPDSELGRAASIPASSYDAMALDLDAMRSLLAGAPKETSGLSGVMVELPRPDGTFEQFEVFSYSIMAPELAAEFSEIQNFWGYSVEDPTRTLQMDLSSLGFHAQVLGANSYLIDPLYHLEDDYYGTYFRADANLPSFQEFDPEHHDDGDSDHNGSNSNPGGNSGNEGGSTSGDGFERTVARPSGTELRTYRTAIAATGEYTQYFGGVNGAMAGINTTMNRVNGIYQSELAIRFELVAGNSQLIFTDPDTDPYSTVTSIVQVGTVIVDQNQDELDDTIGEDNYDFGHLFGFALNGPGGVGAGLVGIDGEKGSGATILPFVEGDVFHVDFVAHEFGHQFGANHIWSFCDGGTVEPTGVEPGSGTSIMGYAGTCGLGNLASNSDPYFHAFNLEQIIAHVDDVIPNVGIRTATPNALPTVDAGLDYTIPAGTPFVLTANGHDPEGRDLLYTWDQMNPGNGDPTLGDLGSGPIYRFMLPSPENSRTFPTMYDLVNNTVSLGENLPTTSRAIDFRVTVRDIVSGVGAINDDDVRVNVVDTGSPFQITTLQSGEVLTGGQSFDFTWDVAGTDGGQINTQNVRITMSTDGGYTYDHVVLNSTANDGAETAYIPNVASNQVRFRIEAIGNVFFDITNSNVTVLAGTNPPGLGGGGGGSPILDSCGIPLPEGTVSFAGAIGGNFFATNHAILDGVQPGGLGFDERVLDFLRGDGTQNEIPKSQYSIAVIGNGDADWAFSNGTQIATGYEKTTYYNINFISPQEFQELIQHDALIILSGEDAVEGGMTAEEMELWATVKDQIATAVNDRGVDIWVGASGGDDDYYAFLPTGALITEDVAGIEPLSGYLPTIEGQLIGLTVDMTNSSDAEYYFLSADDDLFSVEYRYATETISVIGTNVAFYQDAIIPAADVPGGSTVGLTGFVYNDFDGDGFHDPLEPGVAGATFFIDYNGDGLLGLCEPTATSNAAGQFRLRSAYSGEFQVRQVQAPGAVTTTTAPQFVTIAPDGTATLSGGALEFGVISGSDTGAGGTGGSVPVATGAYLGASPVADDGVIFSHGLQKGTNTVTIISSVERTNVVLNAWMDFNKDGDWNDPGERIFTNLKLTPGQNTYTFTIPSNVFDDSMLPDAARLPVDVRFRVGPTWNVGPEANDAFGEIEDYQVFISQPADSGLRAVNDVFQYVEDQDGQVFNVLANDTSFFGRTLTIVPGSVTNISPVEVPPLDIRVSPDGTRIIFDADGVEDLTQDITFEYTVQDSAGNTATATVTLVAPSDPVAPVGGSNSTATFNNSGKAADVNGDGRVTGQDLALLIREFEGGARNLPKLGQAPTNFKRFIDVNADHVFSSVDLLYFINQIRGSVAESEPIMSEPAALLAEGANDTNAPVAGSIRATVSLPQVSPTSSSILWVSPEDGAYGTNMVLAASSVEPVSDVLAEIYSNDAILDSLNGQDDTLLLIAHASANGGTLTSDRDEIEPSVEDQVFGDRSWEEELLTF